MWIEVRFLNMKAPSLIFMVAPCENPGTANAALTLGSFSRTKLSLSSPRRTPHSYIFRAKRAAHRRRPPGPLGLLIVMDLSWPWLLSQSPASQEFVDPAHHPIKRLGKNVRWLRRLISNQQKQAVGHLVTGKAEIRGIPWRARFLSFCSIVHCQQSRCQPSGFQTIDQAPFSL